MSDVRMVFRLDDPDKVVGPAISSCDQVRTRVESPPAVRREHKCPLARRARNHHDEAVNDMTLVARQVTVHGRVQGVFFRDNCRRVADRYGVTGWVQNNPDGTLEAFFEGPADAVQALVEWAHHGPSRATVERVVVTDAEPAGLSAFRVRG